MAKKVWKVLLILFGLFGILICITGCTGTEDYIVQPGDSWWSIATEHEMTIEELEQINGRSSDEMLYPGDVLKVKKQTSTTEVQNEMLPEPETEETYTQEPIETQTEVQVETQAEAQKENIEPKIQYLNYVKQGETMSNFARYYQEKMHWEISANDIDNANQWLDDPDVIHIGWYIQISIPA